MTLGHSWISLQKDLRTIAAFGAGYQRQTRLPISQFLKIRSTSDSEELGNLSVFVG